jgi:hypothetical protein
VLVSDKLMQTEWYKAIRSDSKLLSEFPWPINVNPDNNLESLSSFLSSGLKITQTLDMCMAHSGASSAELWIHD